MFLRRYMLWMKDGSLRRQLPLGYRLFAGYCVAFMSCVGYYRVIGATQMFALALWLNKLAGRPAHFALALPDATVALNLADPRFVKVVKEALPGSEETAILTALLRPGDTFIDVGANHGAFCIAAARLIGSRGAIVAVEPQPTLTPLLEQTLAGSVPCPFVVKTAAAGDEHSTVSLHILPQNSGETSLHRRPGLRYADEVVDVPMAPLDELLSWRELPGNLVIKIDVEGSENMVLRGMRAICDACRPTILLEINPPIMDAAGVCWDDLCHTLRDLGYSRYADCRATDQCFHLENLDPRQRQDIVLSPDAFTATPTPAAKVA